MIAAFLPKAVYLPLCHKCKLDKHSIINHLSVVMYNTRPAGSRIIPSPNSKMYIPQSLETMNMLPCIAKEFLRCY